MQIFNINKKNHIHAEMCAVELYMTISCIYDADLILPILFILTLCNKLCCLFAKVCISSLNSEL